MYNSARSPHHTGYCTVRFFGGTGLCGIPQLSKNGARTMLLVNRDFSLLRCFLFRPPAITSSLFLSFSFYCDGAPTSTSASTAGLAVLMNYGHHPATANTTAAATAPEHKLEVHTLSHIKFALVRGQKFGSAPSTPKTLDEGNAA